MKEKIYEIPYNIKSAIYFLLKDDEIVYVGKTNNGFKRICQHYKKDFNKYIFIKTDKNELDYYEDFYIMKYQPKYNRYYTIKRIGLKSSYRKLNSHIKTKLNYNEYIEYLKNNKIEISKFKNYFVIKKDECEKIKDKLNKKYGD